MDAHNKGEGGADRRWDDGWINSATQEVRLQRRADGGGVDVWRSYSRSGVDTGAGDDVEGEEGWYRLTTLPQYIPDADESVLTLCNARVALLGGKWESEPDEPFQYETPGVTWRLTHYYLNADELPFVLLDGYGAAVGQKSASERVELAWAGFQSLFLAGLAQVVDALSLRSGVLWTTHADVENIRVSTDVGQSWFHPLGLIQFDSKRRSPRLGEQELMHFAAGIRKDRGVGILSSDTAGIQSLLSGQETALRHELLFDAKRIEIISRDHNTLLSQHEWLDRSRFMILCMAMERALNDLARAAGGDEYHDRMYLNEIPSFVAKHRDDWDLRKLAELWRAFPIVRDMRNAVAHGRKRCSIDEVEYDVNDALARHTFYLSQAVWQIVSFCDGCLEGWDWAAERARAPLPPLRHG